MLKQVNEQIPLLVAQLKLNPNQVQLTSLSDLSKVLGLIQAGEFRSGNGKEPGKGFTGIRLGFPPFPYNSALWNLAGVNNDVLQAGISSADGTILGGGGKVKITASGLAVYKSATISSFQAFAVATTYNGESFQIGDILIGDNSTGQPNIKYDTSLGQLQFRNGTTVNSYFGASENSLPFQLIQTTIMVGGETSLVVTIPQTYTHLMVQGMGRDTDGADTSYRLLDLKFNGDGAAGHYRWMETDATMSAIAEGGSASDTGGVAGALSGDGNTASYAASFVCYIPHYRNTTWFKSAIVSATIPRGATDSNVNLQSSTLWKSTAAITSVTFTPLASAFKAGSVISVYGLR